MRHRLGLVWLLSSILAACGTSPPVASLTDAGSVLPTDHATVDSAPPPDLGAPVDTPPAVEDIPLAPVDTPPAAEDIPLAPVDTPPALVDVPAVDAAPSAPITTLDRVHLHLNLGDSVGAGYNASSRDRLGYAALVYRDAGGRGAWAGRDLVSRFPSARRADRARSGWTTSQVLSDLRGAIGSLPPGGDGDDTVVTVSAGGNDFNDNVLTIVTPASADAAAAVAASNVAQVVTLLRGRYHDPARGRRLVVLWTDVHDPTDGMGTVPPRFRSGFCGVLQNPLFIPSLRATALMNLARFNQRLRGAITAAGATPVDSYSTFLGHAMNAPDPARWIDGDCVHPLTEGHHQLRRTVWRTLTGEDPGS